MNQSLALAAAAALILSAAPAMAQTAKTPADPASPPTTSATEKPPVPADQPADTSASTSTGAAASASAAGADVSVKTGMSVKDNTGATIGQISDVKAGADGKTTATIKMGADSFAVDVASLAVADGAATVNATHADIKKMLKK